MPDRICLRHLLATAKNLGYPTAQTQPSTAIVIKHDRAGDCGETLAPLLPFACPALHCSHHNVRQLVKLFRVERMPERFSTRYGYEAWLKNHILPRWGDFPITDPQARPVELWLKPLPLSPKRRVHIRGVIHQRWEFAMWRGDVPTQRNPMSLVAIKGATKRLRKPHNLTEDEFRKFLAHLEEPIQSE
jgi:hypothetical protein